MTSSTNIFLVTFLTGITSYYDAKGGVKDFLKIRMAILKVLVGTGMTPSHPKFEQAGPPEVLHVILDGRVVGSMPSDIVEKAVSYLRQLKVSGVPEVCFVLYAAEQFLGVSPDFLSSSIDT